MEQGILDFLPSGGIATVLVSIIIYLLRQNNTDRAQYRAELVAVQDSHFKQLEGARRESNERLQLVQEEIAALKKEVQELNQLYETERHKRWEAEDAVAMYRRRLEGVNPVD